MSQFTRMTGATFPAALLLLLSTLAVSSCRDSISNDTSCRVVAPTQKTYEGQTKNSTLSQKSGTVCDGVTDSTSRLSHFGTSTNAFGSTAAEVPAASPHFGNTANGTQPTGRKFSLFGKTATTGAVSAPQSTHFGNSSRMIPAADVEYFYRKKNLTPSTDSDALSEQLSQAAFLTLQRSFLELYFMDVAATAEQPEFSAPPELKVTGMMPVEILSKNWDFQNGLIVIEGSVELRKIPDSLLRQDIAADFRSLKKKIYIGTDNLSSAYACLIRQAELKCYYRLLRRYRHLVDYTVPAGKGTALELLNAVQLKSMEFRPHLLRGKILSGKVTFSLSPLFISQKTAAFLGINAAEDIVFNEKISVDEI